MVEAMTRVILPSQVMTHWSEARAVLDAAFSIAEEGSPDTYLDDLVNDRAQLWSAGEAWAITRVNHGKCGRILEILAISGKNMSNWKNDFFSTVEGWAKSHGCVASIATGRVGWLREMPDYKLARVVLRKEL